MSEYKIVADDNNNVIAVYSDDKQVVDYSIVQAISQSTYDYYKDMRYGDDRCKELVGEALSEFEWIYNIPYKKNKRYQTIRGVYFASFKNIDTAIKIGHSVNVWNRLRSLRSSYDVPIEFGESRKFGHPHLHACVVIPEGKEVKAYEMAFHHHFSDYQIGLEFYKSKPVLGSIHSIKGLAE